MKSILILLAFLCTFPLFSQSLRPAPEWLKKAVIYQVYPQSYYDTDDDGTGDLRGIISKLDYIKSLGVSAIWINPFFVSPFRDGGYDVADFYKVAPRYGTNDDFRQLCSEASKRNIRILFDLVAGHCSYDNQWFLESAKEEKNQYSDWFIWDNNPWEVRQEFIRGLFPRYGAYLPNFMVHQPAFNYGYANPQESWQQSPDAPGPMAVRAEMKKIIKFWFDLGASGFRADMALSLVKNDLNGDYTSKIWQDIRSWIEKEYPDHLMIGEGGYPSISIKKAGFHIDFTLPWSMPSYNSLFRKTFVNEGGSSAGVDPYGFSVFDALGHGNIMEFMDEYLKHYAETKDYGYISIVAGNHDLHPRISYGRTKEEIMQVFLFTMTMPGVPFLYYGDEIGLRSIDGLPSKEGSYDRSNVRTPMQWDNNLPNSGFSGTEPAKLYLPIDPDLNRPAVAQEENDPASLLTQMRKLIALKKSLPALDADAGWKLLYAERGKMPLVYERWKGDQKLIIVINPTGQKVEARIPLGEFTNLPLSVWGQVKTFKKDGNNWVISLPPASGGIYK
jgi:maltose alpha-D-glucosyltransferase / alpha-amylase